MGISENNEFRVSTVCATTMISKTTNVPADRGEVTSGISFTFRFWLLFLLLACSLAVYFVDVVKLQSYRQVDPSFASFISHAYGVTVLNNFYLVLVMLMAGYQVVLPKKLCIPSNVIAVLLAGVRIALIEIPPSEPQPFERAITALCGVQIIVTIAWTILEVLRKGSDKVNKFRTPGTENPPRGQ